MKAPGGGGPQAEAAVCSPQKDKDERIEEEEEEKKRRRREKTETRYSPDTAQIQAQIQTREGEDRASSSLPLCVVWASEERERRQRDDRETTERRQRGDREATGRETRETREKPERRRTHNDDTYCVYVKNENEKLNIQYSIRKKEKYKRKRKKKNNPGTGKYLTWYYCRNFCRKFHLNWRSLSPLRTQNVILNLRHFLYHLHTFYLFMSLHRTGIIYIYTVASASAAPAFFRFVRMASFGV